VVGITFAQSCSARALMIGAADVECKMKGEFSAVRQEMRSLGEQLRGEMRSMNDQALAQMRVLHEEVIDRIGKLDEGRRGSRKRSR
jgi:hypothetical protein